ncbi:MAG: 30S ribosomal protein S6e [Nanoarchaeota archaeon]|nr:30S ribosomal protein S6e [Nanoarchaeota archaeon]
MTELKIVVSDPKTGKSFQKAIAENSLSGMKIGQKVDGEGIGLSGYELEVTGGSDDSGFGMRSDMEGSLKRSALLTGGVGIKKKVTRHKEQGIRLRRTVAGNTIGAKTAQVNLKVLKYGSETLAKLFGKEEAPKEEKKEAA